MILISKLVILGLFRTFGARSHWNSLQRHKIIRHYARKRTEYFANQTKNFVFASTLGISKRDFYAKIGVSRGTLESKTGITEDVITKFFATYPEISIEWLMTGEGEMLKNSPSCKEKNKTLNEEDKMPEVSYDPSIGKPYYDVDFLGGFSEIANSQVTIPANNIVIQGFEKPTFGAMSLGIPWNQRLTMATS